MLVAIIGIFVCVSLCALLGTGRCLVFGLIVSLALLPIAVFGEWGHVYHVGITAPGVLLFTFQVLLVVLAGYLWLQDPVAFLSQMRLMLPALAVGVIVASVRWWGEPLVLAGIVHLLVGLLAFPVGIAAGRRMEMMRAAVAGACTCIALQVLVSASGWLGFTTRGVATASDVAGRLSGTLGHPDQLAKVMVFMVFVALVGYTGCTQRMQVVVRGSVLAAVVLTALTGSRVGVAACLALFGARVLLAPAGRRRRRQIGVAAGVAIGVLLLAGSYLIGRFAEDPTGGARWELNGVALDALWRSPLLGIGPNRFVEDVGSFSPLVASGVPVHNSVLLAMVELGIPLALCLLLPGLQLVRRAWRTRQAAGETGETSRLCLGFCAALAIVGLTGWGLLLSYTLPLLYLALGIGFGRLFQLSVGRTEATTANKPLVASASWSGADTFRSALRLDGGQVPASADHVERTSSAAARGAEPVRRAVLAAELLDGADEVVVAESAIRDPGSSATGTVFAGLMRGSAALGVAAIARALSSALIIPLLVRSLGTEGAGYAGAATLVASALGFLSSLGLSVYVTQSLANGTIRYPEARRLVRLRLWLLVGVGMVFGSVAFLTLEGGVALGVALLGLATLLDQAADASWSIARGGGSSVGEAFSTIGASSLTAVAAIVAIRSGGGVTLAIGGAIAVLGPMVNTIMGLAAAHRAASVAPLQPYSHRPVLAHVRKSWPYAASDLMGLAYLRGDVFLLAIIAGTLVTGEYVAATAPFNPLIQIGAMMSIGVIALLSRPSLTADHDLSLGVFRVFVALGGLAAILYLLVGPMLMSLLYADEGGGDLADLVTILALFALVRFANFGLSGIALSRGLARQRFYLVVAALVLNVLVNLLLIPIVGAEGAAVSTLLTEVLVTLGFVGIVADRGLRQQAAELLLVIAVVFPISVLVPRPTNVLVASAAVLALGAWCTLRSIPVVRQAIARSEPDDAMGEA